MTRRRWIADEVDGNMAALIGDHAIHLGRVLRAEVGQEFDIAAGNSVRRATIVSISEERVDFSLGEELSVAQTLNLTLALAIFKFDRMEWAIEKCTELGVARIVPIVARRTDSHLAVAAEKRRERWQRLALQASEQSRRTGPPEIERPIKLKDLCSAGVSPVQSPAVKIVLAESEANTRLRDVLKSNSADVTLAVGPEGGWAPDELVCFRDAGWVAVTLGETILRAETAAIVATALAIDALR